MCANFNGRNNKYGNSVGQFSCPMNIITYSGKTAADPYRIWIADYYNSRIVQLKYTANGNIEWVNSIGNFYGPIDLVYKDDNESEVPTMYVLTAKGGLIVRIPVSDNNISHYQDIEGYISDGGFDIGTAGGFLSPTGICLNRSGDKEGWNNSETYIYVADAGNEKIYQYMEVGEKLQYMGCVELPKIPEQRTHVGIRSDRFGTIYVFDQDAGKVRVYSQNLEPLYDFGSQGDHSSKDIKFNMPYTGFITGDKLFVVDHWGENSGIQCFNIGDIDIINVAVDYSAKNATILADNTFIIPAIKIGAHHAAYLTSLC